MRLEDVLVRQHGALSLAQAHDCGISTRTVRRRVLARAWREVHPRVYLVAGYPLDNDGRVRAAFLWGGPSAVVSGFAAAFWHGLTDRAGPLPEITMPRTTSRPSRDDVRVRRRDLDPLDVVVRRGVAVTALPLTVLETAADLPDGEAFLDRVLQQGRVRFAGLPEAYSRGNAMSIHVAEGEAGHGVGQACPAQRGEKSPFDAGSPPTAPRGTRWSPTDGRCSASPGTT